MTDGPRSTLLETVRIRSGVAPLWHLHVRRLSLSCLALRVPFPATLETPSGGRDRVYRLAVSGAGSEVTEREVGPDTPVRLMTSAVIHPGYRHKTTEREAFVRAAESARVAGYDDAAAADCGGRGGGGLDLVSLLVGWRSPGGARARARNPAGCFAHANRGNRRTDAAATGRSGGVDWSPPLRQQRGAWSGGSSCTRWSSDPGRPAHPRARGTILALTHRGAGR